MLPTPVRFWCILALCAAPAGASDIEKWLIMPGPVVESHASIEADCDACHAPLSEQDEATLCNACHTEIGNDIAARKGFHGRLPPDEGRQCASCHVEHEGRDAVIVVLDEATFDHDLTDFPLLGGHSSVACGACHSQGEPHREAPTECVACHRQDDIHGGRLGDDCGSCHTPDDWRDALFDHGKTGFPLTGGHSSIECGACHASDDFAQVGKTCASCHSDDDVHKGRNGPQCADCHSATNWTEITFNHMAVSGFALVGGHKSLTCQDCHRAADFKDLDNATCHACHRNDDPHEGRFGTDCASCHNNFHWDSVIFNHKAETGFELPAGHRNLTCDACHTGPLTQPLASDCGGCHAADDVHLGQLGDRCAACHVPTSWTARLWFDHDITTFPLLGAHAVLGCESCHASAAFHDADTACISCHVEEDPHRGGLGDRCDDCHNPADWHAWLFDHEQQTTFALTGAHTTLACEACHTEATGGIEKVSDDCSSCHRRDDPHFGRFGNNCESCHTTNSFAEIEGM